VRELIALGTAFILWSAGAGVAAGKPDWDRVANVKSAAVQIGGIQKRDGVDRAFKFIGACYKTHGLASAYSKAFEGCIAQDYIQSRALSLVYDRVDAATLKRMGSPTSEQIMMSLNARLNSAFSKYEIPVRDGQDFVRLVETQGVPVFLSIVFPPKDGDAAAPGAR
jgi:hypothetical protein